MNSIEALDFALVRLGRIRLTSNDWEAAQEAIDTLRGLRQIVLDLSPSLIAD